jgi:hypothetical protein
MRKLQPVWMLAMLLLTLGMAWGQDESTSATPPPVTSQQQQPIPAYGQENAPPPITENPPISGLDQPGLEPHSAPISYLQPGVTVSESADSNIGNTLGTGQSFRSVTRGLASLTLQRLWSHYDLALDYVGGAAYYDQHGLGFTSLQQLDLDQKMTWKRGQLSLRDSFSYLPEGNFGGAYGSLGSQGIASLGTTALGSFWSGAALGTLGQASRILNASLGEITENLTPKSAVTAAGGYAFTHFYGNDFTTGAPFLGSSQTSFLVGYDRLLTSRTQVAIVYGYQAFDFSVLDTAFHSDVIQLMYGHRVSGRMDFIAAAGPQFVNASLPGLVCGNPPTCTDLVPGNIPDHRIGVAARAQLRYRFTKSSMDLSYQRLLTSGSGFFAGAESDIARLSVTRPLNRIWNMFADLGYSRNSREIPLSAAQLATCAFPGQTNPGNLPPCPGIDANVYNIGFAGFGVHRAVGRTFHVYGSYQFNELSFDHSYCGGLTACSRIGNRNVITVGLDWTPRPIRLD